MLKKENLIVTTSLDNSLRDLLLETICDFLNDVSNLENVNWGFLLETCSIVSGHVNLSLQVNPVEVRGGKYNIVPQKMATLKKFDWAPDTKSVLGHDIEGTLYVNFHGGIQAFSSSEVVRVIFSGADQAIDLWLVLEVFDKFILEIKKEYDLKPLISASSQLCQLLIKKNNYFSGFNFR